MKRICAWCDLVMSQGTTPDAEITHGICPDCFQIMMFVEGQAKFYGVRRMPATAGERRK